MVTQKPLKMSTPYRWEVIDECSSLVFRLGLRLQPQPPLNDSYFSPAAPNTAPKPTNPHLQAPKPPSKDRTSLNDYDYNKAPSTSKGKAPQRRTRVPSSVNSDALVQQLLAQQAEAKESRRLLRIAVEKVETLQQRAVIAEEARKGETERGLRIAQTALRVQEEMGKTRQNAEVYKLQLDRVQREIKHQQELVKTVQAERERAEKSAAKARDMARQLNDERMIALARQEGRKMGFVEGMKRGRKLAIADREKEAPLTAFIEEFETPRPPPPQPITPPSEVARMEREAAEALQREREAAEAAQKVKAAAEAAQREREAAEAAQRVKEAAEAAQRVKETAEAAHRELEAVQAARRQIEAMEAARRELEAAKRHAEEQVRREAEERERRREAEALEAERRREAMRAAEREVEQQKIREREAELERQQEAIRAHEAARALEMEAVRQREQEKERELAQERERERALEEERNYERRQREEREAELASEREKVRELEREREVASVSTASQRSQRPKRLDYLPMPQPPASLRNSRSGVSSTPAAATASPLPLHIPPPNFRPPQQFQPPVQRRRTSQSSQETSHSGSTSINNFDIVTFPTTVRSHLSDIPEVASDIGRSPAPSAGQSPVEATNLRNVPGRRGMEDVQRWVESTAASEVDTEPATTPTPTRSTFRPRNSPYGDNIAPGSLSSGSIPIEVLPPSRPTSSLAAGPAADNMDMNLLTPTSRPLQLAPDPHSQPQHQPQHHPHPQYQNHRSPYDRHEPEPDHHTPVIPDIPPDMFDGSDGDGITHLTNFGSPMFIPLSVSRGPNSEAGSSDDEERRREERERARAERASERKAKGIYGPPPASSSGARTALYAQPRNPSQGQVPRTPLYAPPSGTAGVPRQSQPSQTSMQPPMQIYSPAQTPRQIYSNIPPSSSSGSTTGPTQPSRNPIYAASAPPRPLLRNTIYAPDPSTSTPVIPPSPSVAPRSAIYAASPRSTPVIPPPPGQTPGSDQTPFIPPPPRQIYNNNATGPVIPSSSANGYPYPVSPGGRPIGLPPGATPGSYTTPLAGAARTPGRSYVPSLPTMGSGMSMSRGGMTPASRTAVLPSDMGWDGGMTPASQTRVLPGAGGMTPRVNPANLDEEDEDGLDDDMVTRINTQVNSSGRGGRHVPLR
ncbi:hypothetical protein C0991_006755 [Blastosporella zonata]|nr:hypothetical protein C0991_006755 [Blastosporella zonata]